MPTEDKVFTDKEILTIQRNTFRSRLIKSSVDQKFAEEKAKVDPNALEAISATQKITIWDKIDACKKNKTRYKLYIAVIDTLLKMEKAGLLDELWDEESLKMNPRPVIHKP